VEKPGVVGVTGLVLLLAAAPVGKGRLIDAASVLPALAAVPPAAFTGTPVSSVVELADPLDPQTVLTRIRAAAAVPGPLSLCIAGQLHVDRRQRLLHVALARTSTATLRYTALPWHWLAGELSRRAPGTTTVLVDLVADAEAWREASDVERLRLGAGVRLYGRVAAQPARGPLALPAYLGACAGLWRSGARPPLAVVHQHAAARAAQEGPAEAVLLASEPGQGAVPPPPRAAPPVPPHAAPATRPPAGSPARPGTAPVFTAAAVAAPPPAAAAPGDPHPAILAAAGAGRHGEAAAMAAAWESEALRAHGPRSLQAVHWLEVRADLARLAEDPARSCQLWTTAAETRLALGQHSGAAELEGAVNRAHHQWQLLTDADQARTLGRVLLAVRVRVPGPGGAALAALERALAQQSVGALHPAP
jgi:hypothetical protein